MAVHFHGDHPAARRSFHADLGDFFLQPLLSLFSRKNEYEADRYAAQYANPAQLAHGISVALYNTAFGLIVAIPALIFWRYFRARVDEYLLTLELAAERFARHLNNLRRA